MSDKFWRKKERKNNNNNNNNNNTCNKKRCKHNKSPNFVWGLNNSTVKQCKQKTIKNINALNFNNCILCYKF